MGLTIKVTGATPAARVAEIAAAAAARGFDAITISSNGETVSPAAVRPGDTVEVHAKEKAGR